MNLSSYGTTFVDLKYILHSSIEKISLVILFQSCGCLLGSCCKINVASPKLQNFIMLIFTSLVGFTYKWLNRQLTMAIALFIFSIVVVLIPFSAELWQLYMCSFVVGIGYGVYFNSYNVWILELFKDKAGPVIQLSGFIFGIGTILGPLLYQSYVTGGIQLHPDDQFSALSIDDLFNFDDNQTAMTYNQTYYLIHDSDETLMGDMTIGGDEGLRRFKLKIPFLICGIIVIIGKN